VARIGGFLLLHSRKLKANAHLQSNRICGHGAVGGYPGAKCVETPPQTSEKAIGEGQNREASTPEAETATRLSGLPARVEAGDALNQSKGYAVVESEEYPRL
jgi:hypothetical protein